MLSWAFVCFIVALIAAALGFGAIAGAATGIAKILFCVFLVAFAVSLVTARRPRMSDRWVSFGGQERRRL